MKIYLSPSTQEKNIGVSGYGTEEKRMNLLADIVEQKLWEQGHVIERNTPDMTVQKIAVDSNLKRAELHIALHSNAGTGKSQGCEIFCHKFGGAGEKLAKSIYKYLEAITPSKDRGVKEGYNAINGKPMYELAHTSCPAILIETAFHDNPTDAMWLIENMDLIATSIVKGLNDHIGVKKPVVDSTQKNYKKLYEELLKEIQGLVKLYGGVS